MSAAAGARCSAFVRVQGGEFIAPGSPAGSFVAPGAPGDPFVPRGLGSYPLLDHAGRGRLRHITDIFAQAHALGRPLLRTNAFFEGGTSPARLRSADGTLHEPGLRALDQVLAMAREHGVALILPVANNWDDYGGARAVVRMVSKAADPTAPVDKDRFFDDPRCHRAQHAFIVALLTRKNHITGERYGEDPTVFAWELCNEPRLGRSPRSRLRHLSQPLRGRASRRPGRTLAAWAVAMRRAFDAGGAQQLVGWGGSGHRGDHGEDMEAVLATGAVDFATLHLYPFATHPALLRMEPWSARASAAVEVARALVADRTALARRYGVPLLMEEFGWKTGAHTLPEERLQVMRGMLHAARVHGVGTLPWMVAERGRPDYDGLLIRPEQDALVALLSAC